MIAEFTSLGLVSTHYRDKQCLKSAIFYTEEDLSFLEGTVQWICDSPFRPHHKRKNGFIDISIIREEINVSDTSEVRFEIFRSSGNGGQNVNKVSTAVRAIHIPTRLFAVSMDQRSQLQNKKIAYLRLVEKIDQKSRSINSQICYLNWRKHHQMIRGQPIRIYQGLHFK